MSRPRISITLLLKVAIFIFALLVVVTEVCPLAFRPSKTRGIDEATNLVCGKILLTRQKAIASRTSYRIHYDYPTGQCVTYRELIPGRWIAELNEDERIPQGVAISPTSTPSNGYIEIRPDGAIDNHGVPVILRLVDGEGTQKSIRISPAGMVQEIPTW
jgi:hypothetical protein